MSRTTALRANDIVVGRALPYSVYGADKTLLLAKGQIVSERIRDALLRNGVMRSATEDDAFPTAAAVDERIEVPEPCPLQALRNHYAKAFGTARLGFRMSRDDRSEAYTAWVIGTHEQRGLILSAPVSRDNSLVAVSDGQTWVFRAFYGTAAFRFAGGVRKVAFEPYGLTIEPRNDFEHMLLHAYVHERLVDELDATWKILAGANELAATSP